MGSTHLTGCHECDLQLNLPVLQHGEKASCPRCGFVITRFVNNAANKIMACATTALIFLILAVPFPFIIFSTKGNERTITLIQSFTNISSLEFDALAILLVLTTFLIPLFFLLSIIYIQISLRLSCLLPHTKTILKLIFKLNQWNMAEIFLVGILVSFIKVVSVGKVALGTSFFSYGLFVVFLAATSSFLDQYQTWQRIKQHG